MFEDAEAEAEAEGPEAEEDSILFPFLLREKPRPRFLGFDFPACWDVAAEADEEEEADGPTKPEVGTRC